MGIDKSIRIVSIAAWIYDAELEESKTMGEAIRKAVEASDRKVAFLASGSLSHRIAPNQVVDDYLFRNTSPFNCDHAPLTFSSRNGRWPYSAS